MTGSVYLLTRTCLPDIMGQNEEDLPAIESKEAASARFSWPDEEKVWAKDS